MGMAGEEIIQRIQSGRRRIQQWRFTRFRSLFSSGGILATLRKEVLAAGLALMLLSRSIGLALPASMKIFFDDVLGKRRHALLGPLALGVIAAVLAQSFVSRLQTIVLSKEAERLIAELRCRLQSQLLHLPISFHDANKSGALVSRIMTDVEGIRGLIGPGLIDFLGALVTAVGALAWMFHISAILSLIALGFGAVFLGAMLYWLVVTRVLMSERSLAHADVYVSLTESMAGVRIIKTYNGQLREAAAFHHRMARLLDVAVRAIRSSASMSSASTAALGMLIAIVMVVGGHAITAGTLTVGGLVSFIGFVALLFAPVMQIAGFGTQLSMATVAFDRAQSILMEQPEEMDVRRNVTLINVGGDIVFEGVCFEYEPGNRVLYDISFHAVPGTITALVGQSGAGKSTIANLVAGFYTPTKNTIWVDGIDLSTVRLESYRSHIGVVFQDTFLFDGTIAENVSFARPGASMDEIIQACQLARVDEFAMRSPSEYDTSIGERGIRLSGGQRQRIAIARAILANPRILILDEATSSLDSETEELVQQGLGYLMRGRTTIVIAHRLSTIQAAHQILVIEDGRVVEHGSHDYLYATGGRYFALYTRQPNAKPSYAI